MSKPTDTTSEALKCPVDHDSRDVWMQKLQPNEKLPTGHPQVEGQVCPVDDETKKVWLQKNEKKQDIPAPAIECSSDQISSHPKYLTDVKLPDDREVSSIPRTGTEANWVYPSEKQFYEAMVRKQWEPQARDMQTVVPLHNVVNERVWGVIKGWEKDQGGDSCGGIKLTSFKGDSKKLTPRAWIRSSILGYSKPFDRHDWTVNRCGKNIDYVIDFYSNDEDESKIPDIYLDVRPKLNSFEGFKLRIMKSLGF